MLQYFLAPTRDTPPETLIRLGNIVEQPRFADRPLNRHPIPVENIILGPESKDQALVFDNTKTYSIGIWASFLIQILGIGGDVNLQISKGTTENWNCDAIKTVFFEPNTEYIKKSLEAADIKQYIHENRNWLWDTKLYMITGIKIAYGAKGTISYARNKGIHLHLGVDATPLGAPVQAGPDIGVEKGRSVTQSIGDEEPFVLAFRMQRIKVSAKGDVRHRHVEGDMLGLGLGHGEVGDEEEDVELVVDGLKGVDADAGEFGIWTSWMIGNEGVGDMGCCALAEDD